MDRKNALRIADEELNECLARIQKRIGVEHGDFAGVYFTGDNEERYEEAVDMLAYYIQAELDFRAEG